MRENNLYARSPKNSRRQNMLGGPRRLTDLSPGESTVSVIASLMLFIV
ncbi:hypothetical protein YpAngola_A3026 [Yersinia pestis Angola]|nr:hypothetical protein YpAngola_A3026 [Yersinia pestis Angola]